MAMICQITTTDGEQFDAPITLKVVAEWEQWSGRTLADLARPTATDFAYLAWRASLYARKINRRIRFDDFMKKVTGWDILNIEPNAVEVIEEWLKEQ